MRDHFNYYLIYILIKYGKLLVINQFFIFSCNNIKVPASIVIYFFIMYLIVGFYFRSN